MFACVWVSECVCMYINTCEWWTAKSRQHVWVCICWMHAAFSQPNAIYTCCTSFHTTSAIITGYIWNALKCFAFCSLANSLSMRCIHENITSVFCLFFLVGSTLCFLCSSSFWLCWLHQNLWITNVPDLTTSRFFILFCPFQFWILFSYSTYSELHQRNVWNKLCLRPEFSELLWVGRAREWWELPNHHAIKPIKKKKTASRNAITKWMLLIFWWDPYDNGICRQSNQWTSRITSNNRKEFFPFFYSMGMRFCLLTFVLSNLMSHWLSKPGQMQIQTDRYFFFL